MHLFLVEINSNEGAVTKQAKEKKNYYFNFTSLFVKESENEKGIKL